jgi:UDP-GlcNAc:undecaprenyl-phosphate/decaprenyl-phosphate GlcNAc-1-phosphate transferase
LDKGFSQRQIVLGYYVFCTFFGVLTLITSSQLFKFIALGVLGLLVIGGFIVLTRLNQGRSSTSSS